MSRLQKQPSYLKYYILVSLVIHLGLLILIPFSPTTVATRGYLESKGKFYDVEFVQIKPEKVDIKTPGQNNNDMNSVIKPEPEKQSEKKPVDKPLIEEPKPEEKTQGIKGTEDKPIKTEANLEEIKIEPQDDPGQEPEKKPEQEPVTKPEDKTEPQPDPEPEKKPETKVEPEPTPETEKKPETKVEPPSEPAEPEITPDQVLTNKNSDEIIEIEKKPEQKTEPQNQEPEVKESISEGTTEEPIQSEPTETVPSTPEDVAEPEPAPEPEIEKTPALPTNAGETIAQSVKPVYPKGAANEGVEGVVVLEVIIEATGTIKNIEITQSSGDSRLDTVALNTIRKGWTFRPYPYPYTIQMVVEYKAGDTEVILGELKFLE